MSSKKRRSSKAQPQSKSSPLTVLGIGVIVIVAAIIVGAIASSNGTQKVSSATLRSGLISPAEYMAQFSAVKHLLLDVRTVGEFQSGHIPGAANIPVDELSQRLAEVPKDIPVVLYCRSGNRSAYAARILRSAGYEMVYDLGGLIKWQAQGYPIQR
ncbi:MAG: rhodanese-like domain-containing protein [Anaerolineae bacterium]|nr:rhodanese-like domain-containing protein [Anaerolineae bacterium]